MNNEKPYFQLKKIGEIMYPVVNRKHGRLKIDECPYCGEELEHSPQSGHRYSHCTDSHHPLREIVINETLIPKTRGYVIVEY